MLKVSSFIFLVNLLFISYGQTGPENTLKSLSGAAAESFSIYDIPAAGMLISSAAYPLHLRNKLGISRFSFDHEFQESFYVPGSSSFGSVDPRLYPQTVFFGRMAYAAVGGIFFGIETKESFKHNFVFMKAVLYNYVATELVKNLIHRNRPDNSDDKSFFSGHTSSAFVTSTFLYQEINSVLNEEIEDNTLRTVLKSGSFAALYGWAGYVGYSRMRDNKHYFSDVLIGAAAGTAIGIYFYNLYFDNDPGIIDNFSLGIQNDHPVLNFHMSLN